MNLEFAQMNHRVTSLTRNDGQNALRFKTIEQILEHFEFTKTQRDPHPPDTTEAVSQKVKHIATEIDVDDTQCSEQLADVSVLQIADRIVEVVTAFHGSESQNEPSRRSSTFRPTCKWVKKIGKDSQSPAASCERTGCEDCL